MSSDDAYAAFLDRANQSLSADTGSHGNSAAETSSSDASGFHATKTVDEGLQVPRPLVDVGEVYYVSEADEVWEPVVLRWEGREWPSDEQFKSLIFPTPPPSALSSDLSLECLRPSAFDPQNHYAAVLKAVSAAAAGENSSDGAGAGDVKSAEDKLRVWRVGFGRSRAEYWVVGMEEGGGRIVGMKARAVET